MKIPARLAVLCLLVLTATPGRTARAQTAQATEKGAQELPGPTAPIPAALRNAHSIFLSNAGADGGLFPHPFSGDTSRGYVEFYNKLKEMGEHDLVADPSQADLVLELHLAAPYGPSDANKAKGAADPVPAFRLTIYDRKSHYVLWELTQPVQTAVKQQTHDRNFDEALTNLLADFQALTRPLPDK